MKKHVLLVAVMLISIASMAQSKGDRYVSGTLGFDSGNQPTILKEGAFSYTQSQPLDTELKIGAEYGFFAADNLRIAMAIGASWGSSPIAEYDWGWAKRNVIACSVNPSIAYYIRLTDNFYYTPEIGMTFERGKMSEQVDETEKITLPALGWAAYVQPFAFEFKVSEKIALGAIIGSINYLSATFSDDTNVKSKSEIVVNQLKFNMNESSIHLRFYY